MATRRPAVPRTSAAKGPATPSSTAAKKQGDPPKKQTTGAPTTGGSANTGRSAKTGAAKPGATKLTGAKGAKTAQGAPNRAQAKAVAQPAEPPATAEASPVPARAFSGRLLALAVVLVAITIMLAPTVRIFLSQRAEISSLEADIAARKADQDSLRQSISRWEDPNFVKQQARDRINMVMPGETSYWVFGGDTGTGHPGTAGQSQGAAEAPWAEAFWESLRRAATD